MLPVMGDGKWVKISLENKVQSNLRNWLMGISRLLPSPPLPYMVRRATSLKYLTLFLIHWLRNMRSLQKLPSEF